MSLMDQASLAHKRGDFREELKHTLILKRNRMDLIWSFKAGNDITCICKVNESPKNRHEKQIIIGSKDHHVYSLSMNKEIVWEFEAKDEITSLLSFDITSDLSDEIIAGSLDNHIYILSSNGDLLWKYELPAGVTCVKVIKIQNTNIIVAGTNSGCIYFVPYNKNEIIWEYACDSNCIINSLCISRTKTHSIYLGGSTDNIIAATNKGKIFILNFGERKLSYHFSLPEKAAVYSILAEDIDGDGENEIVTCSESCMVYMLDCFGRQKWQFQTKDSVYSLHCCDINHDNCTEILVGTKDNRVYVLNSQGEFMWEFETKFNVWSIYASHVVHPLFYDIFTGLSNRTVNYYKLVDLKQVSHRIEEAYVGLFSNQEEELKVLEDLTKDEDEYIRSFALGKVVNFSQKTRYRENIYRSIEKGLMDSSPIVRSESVKSIFTLLDYEFDRSLSMLRELLVYEKNSAIRNDLILSIVHASLRIAHNNKKMKLYGLLNYLGQAWEELDRNVDYNLFEKAKDDLLTGNYKIALEYFEALSYQKIDLIWKYSTSGYVRTIISYDIDSDGFSEIMFTSRGNNLYVLDYRGNLRWEVKGHCNNIVIIDDKGDDREADIILVYADGTIQFYSHAGIKKKELCLNINFNISKAYLLKIKGEESKLILNCNDNSVCVIDKDGEMIWKFISRFPVNTIFTFDLDGDETEEIIIGTRFGQITVFDYTGKELWTYTCEQECDIEVVNAVHAKDMRDILILIGGGEKIWTLNKRGQFQWEYTIGTSGVNNIYAIDINDDFYPEIIVGVQDKKIFVFDYQGRLLYKIKTPSPIRGISCGDLDNDGHNELVVGGDDENVYCYRIMYREELEDYIEEAKKRLKKIEGKARFKRVSVFTYIKNTLESKVNNQKIILNGFLGSGRSEILWEINAGDLGENYLPIYFPFNYLKFKDTPTFLSKFVEIITKGLHRREIHIPLFPRDKFLEDYHAAFKNFLEAAVQKIPRNKKVILLLDNYRAIENSLYEGILDDGIFYLFSKMLDTKKFAFISSISPDILENAHQSKSKDFLLSETAILDINYIDKYEAEKGLRERLSDYVEDCYPLIDKIIELSASHAFLIQMILAEVIKYLQEKPNKTINKSDWGHIIDNILATKEPALMRPWDTCSCYDKLVLTALAMSPDNMATCREIRENLGIFGNLITNGKLTTILRNSVKRGIVKDRYGTDEIKYSFTVPLLLLWVKKNKSILQIINEYSVSLLKDVPIKQFIAFNKQLKLHIKSDVFLQSINFDLERWDQLIEFCRKWIALTEKKSHKEGMIIDLTLLSKLVKLLARIFGFSIVDSYTSPELTFYRFETPTLRLKKLHGLTLICFHKIQLTKKDFNTLMYRITTDLGDAEKVFLVLMLDDSPIFENRCKDSKMDLVVLKNRDILNILFSPDYLKALMDQVILRQISFVDISPYETMGPATNMFFGRLEEIRTILQNSHKCFALIGSRRLGKTSLMLKIHHQVSRNKKLQTLYLDCSLYNLDRSLFRKSNLLLRFCNDVLAGLGFESENIEDIRDFKTYIINNCKKENKRVALFLDEIDGLLALDKEENGLLFSTFRALYHEKYLTLVIAGYEELFLRTKDIQSPLFNFLQTIRLTPLDKTSAGKLIVEPMRELSIEFDETWPIVEETCNITNCFPNLIQDLCGRLIRLIAKKNRHKIYLSDIEEIEDDPEFQNYIIDMFFYNLSTLGKIIVLLIIDTQEFDAYHIHGKLRSVGIELKQTQLSDEIDKIVLSSLITRVKTKYRFTLSRFPIIFKNIMEPKLLLKQLIKEVK